MKPWVRGLASGGTALIVALIVGHFSHDVALVFAISFTSGLAVGTWDLMEDIIRQIL